MTIHLNPAATFSDGTPVRAEDVEFSWKVWMNPIARYSPALKFWRDTFKSCSIIDSHTLRIKTRKKHFKNLERLAQLLIIPKHIYGNRDLDTTFGTNLIGSGPYSVGSVVPNDRVILTRQERYWNTSDTRAQSDQMVDKYWGHSLRQNQGRYNFEKIIFRFATDVRILFSLFQAGEIDYFHFFSSKLWLEAPSTPLESRWVKKIEWQTQTPFPTQAIAWNVRRPLFEDRKVRLALAHALDRKRYIRDLFSGQYDLSSGIMEGDSPYRHPKNNPLAFNPSLAKTLLAKAGWRAPSADGPLMKGSLRFEFNFLFDNPSQASLLSAMKDDLNRVGIRMNVRPMESSELRKLTHKHQFDAFFQGWVRDVDPSDLFPRLGSEAADSEGGENFSGYKNAEVDTLVRAIDTTQNRGKRILMVQRVDALMAREQPMTFLYESNRVRVAYWDRFAVPSGKPQYTTWKDAFHYWARDDKKDNGFQEAQSKDSPRT